MLTYIDRFLRFLYIGKEFSDKYKYLDTAIYTLFALIDEGIAEQKKSIYKLKLLLFPFYVFYKYFDFKSVVLKQHVINYPDVKILTIIHGASPQHYGDLAKLVEELTKNREKILIIYGQISEDQKNYLGNLKNVFLFDQIDAAFKIGILEFITNLFRSVLMLRELLICIKDDHVLLDVFQQYKGFLLDNIFLCLAHFNLSKKIIQNNSIRVVFSSNDGSYIARGYFINANSYKIENIILQHGVSPITSTKAIAKKIVLWSQSEVEFYIKNDFERERILPLGLPRFDDAIEETIETVNNLKEIYNVQDNQFKVCFATASHAYKFYEKYHREYFEEINNVSSFLLKKNYQVFIRIHPNDNIMDYNRLLSADVISKVVFPPPSFSLIQLIKQMDLFISFFSTVLNEAILCGIPSIFYNLDNYWNSNDLYNYKGVGYGYEINKKGELLSVIYRILHNDNFKSDMIQRQTRYISDNLFNVGSATKNIANYIRSIAY